MFSLFSIMLMTTQFLINIPWMVCFHVMSIVKLIVDQVFTFAGLLGVSWEVAQPMENMGYRGSMSQSVPISAFTPTWFSSWLSFGSWVLGPWCFLANQPTFTLV